MPRLDTKKGTQNVLIIWFLAVVQCRGYTYTWPVVEGTFMDMLGFTLKLFNTPKKAQES